MKRATSVDEYLENAAQWQNELRRPRAVLQSTSLQEEVKWGAPAYTHNGKIVVGVGGFKNWFCLWFHQSELLQDPADVLVNAQEGKTKALRQWRMTSKSDIEAATIKRYVNEAVALADAGVAIRATRAKVVVVPEELQKATRRCKGATAAYRKLTPGKQREYADHIGSAKRDDSKKRRIDKILPMIVAGVGLHHKYRNC